MRNLTPKQQVNIVTRIAGGNGDKGKMKIGDKVQVKYRINEKKHEIRTATVEYISRGWVALRFAKGYVECFWKDKVRIIN